LRDVGLLEEDPSQTCGFTRHHETADECSCSASVPFDFCYPAVADIRAEADVSYVPQAGLTSYSI
jgi:hypothetical protein